MCGPFSYEIHTQVNSHTSFTHFLHTGLSGSKWCLNSLLPALHRSDYTHNSVWEDLPEGVSLFTPHDSGPNKAGYVLEHGQRRAFPNPHALPPLLGILQKLGILVCTNEPN